MRECCFLYIVCSHRKTKEIVVITFCPFVYFVLTDLKEKIAQKYIIQKEMIQKCSAMIQFEMNKSLTLLGLSNGIQFSSALSWILLKISI